MKIAHRKNVLLRDRAWWDTAVNLASGAGGYAHSELIFTNGQSFTSTTQFDPATAIYPPAKTWAILGRKNGPLVRQIEFPAWQWDFTELPVTDTQELWIWKWCVDMIDQSIPDQAGYDWAGVLRFVFKFMQEHPQDWFCSEAVVAACQQAGFFAGLKPWSISPNRLRRLCAHLKPS